MIALFEPEGPGHSTAAGIQNLKLQSKAPEHGLLVAQPHNRAMVAMKVNNRLTLELLDRVIGRAPLQKFAQQKGLPRKPLRILVVSKKIFQLIAKHRRTARLQHDQWRAGANVSLQSLENICQPALSRIQHSVIVKRPAAAKILLWHEHLET